MNDSLNRWLTNRGYTGSLNDKIRQYLLFATAEPDTGRSTNDLWIEFGFANGYGTNLQVIQKNWAIDKGATSTLTWNDSMGSLPP